MTPIVFLVHADGTRVPLDGMRSTITGELRAPTKEELTALAIQWSRYGDPRVKIVKSNPQD